MRRRILFFIFILISFSAILQGQNAIVGNDFSTGWGGSCPSTGNSGFSYMSEVIGNTYGRITQPSGNTSGDKYWRYGVDWDGTTIQMTITPGSDITVSPGTKYSLSSGCASSGTLKYTVPSGGGSWNYIFKTLNAGSSPTGTIVFFEVQGDVRTFTSHSSPNSSSVYPGLAQRLTVTMSGVFNTGQSAYIRYHTGADFSAATIIKLTYSGSGNDYYADIPASANRYGTTVTYYFFTSGSGLTISNDDADLFTINYLNNGGSNYSYQVNGTWLAESDGVWSSASTWNVNMVPPLSHSMGPVTIKSNVTFNQNATVSSLTINSDKTFTASGSEPVTLTVDANASGTTLNNNGTWVQGNGGNTVVFSAGADMTHTVSGEIPFQHVTISRSSGIPAVGVNFGSNSTVSGTLKLTVGSYVNTNAPTYLSGSYLQYSIGSAYDRNVEWSQNSGNAYPHHVKISDNTTLNAFNGTTSPRQIAGNLIIDNGSTFSMGEMNLGGSYDVGIIIGGDTLLNKGTVTLSTSVERLQCNTYLGETGSTLILSGVYGGDLELKGDYTNLGNFTSNSRALFFTGSAGDQNITFSGGQQFDYMIVHKSAGNVVLGNDIQINKLLTLTSGLITSKTGNSYSVIMGDSPDSPSIENASAVSYIDGKLRQTFTSAMTLQYPVGKGGEYRPVTFEYASLTGTSYVMVEHVDQMQPGSIQEGIWLLEDRHWEVTQSGGSSFTYKITLDPNISDALGNIMIGKYENSTNTWHATTSPNYTNLTPFTTLSGTNAFALAEDCTVEVLGDNDTTCYPTLQTAFHAINNGLHTGDIMVLIHGSTTETSTATLNASGSGPASYSGVTIYPTLTGLSISGDLNAPLLELNGADNVTIDGRVNATGNTKDLTVVNANTGTGASTIRFVNSACENKVQYCTLKGSTTNTSGGVVFFDDARLTDPEGNNRNVICENNITNANDARPMHAVYSDGTNEVGFFNSSDTIRDNHVYDFLSLTGASSGGVTIADYNSQWVIQENSFFETTTLQPTEDVSYHAIKISTIGAGHRIIKNFIGGNQPECAGNYFDKDETNNNEFNAIELTVSDYFLEKSATIENNVIKNINWKNNDDARWRAIYLNECSADNRINVKNNVIGDSTGTGSIIFSSDSPLAIFYGIFKETYASSSIIKNVIGSIELNNNDIYGTTFSGIEIYSGSFNDVDSIAENLIGSNQTLNSIIANSTASGSFPQTMFGIQNGDDGSVIISSNIIRNLSNNAKSVSNISNISGIYSDGGDLVIEKNRISDLTISGGIGAQGTSSLIGINIVDGGFTTEITDNQIFNLINNNDTLPTSVIGLVYGSDGGGSVKNNFIHSLQNHTTNTDGFIIGISILTTSTAFSTTTLMNNIISLNYSHAGSNIQGINLLSGLCEVSFNTVSLSGSGNSNTDAALQIQSAEAGTYWDIQNNIFSNELSSLNHFAAYVSNPSNLTNSNLDYNDYWGDTLNIGPIKNSLFLDPLFSNPGGTSPGDLTPAADSLQADVNTLGTVTTDYFGLTRCFPTMGAIEVPNIPDTPSPITGKTEVCPNESGLTYSCPEVPYTTNYTWTVPTGWSITSGQGTISITVTVGATGANGSITVVASNNCGENSDSLEVSVDDSVPTATLDTVDPICSGQTTALTVLLTGHPPWSITYTANGNPVTVSNITATPFQIPVAPIITTVYQVTNVTDSRCSSDIPSNSITVTVKPKPVTGTILHN